MRLSLKVSLLMLASGCFCLPAPAYGQEPLSDLAWLANGWWGTMGKARIEEHWIEPVGGMMLGLSRTVAGGRTISFEFLRGTSS